MGAFTDIATQPGAELYMAAQLQPFEADGVTVRNVRITTAPYLFTGAADTPSNALFKSVAMTGWRTKRRVSSRGSFTGRSDFSTGELVLDATRGDLDDWDSLIWDNRPVTIHMGGRRKKDGSPFLWTDYETVFVGLTRRAEPGRDRQIEIEIAGRKVLLADPVEQQVYRAFGGAVDLPDGAKIQAATEPSALDFPAPIAWEFIGRVVALPAVQATFGRRATGWGLAFDPAGLVSFITSSGTTATTYSVLVGVIYLGASVAADGVTATLYGGIDGNDVDEVWTGTLLDAIDNNFDAGLFKVGPYLSAYGHLEPWEFRIWKKELTLDDVLLRVDGPISTPNQLDDLAEVFKLGEQVGTVSLGEKTGISLNLQNGATFTSSLTGDDPEQFDGSILGQTVQDAAGPVFNAPLVPVDTGLRHFLAGRRAWTDFRRVKVRGAPLIPDEQQLAVGVGDISFKDGDTIVLSAGLTGHRFIPGQAEPERQGQRLDVVDSGGAWDATYNVAVDGVSADGLEVQVIDEITGSSPAFDTGDGAAGTKVQTPGFGAPGGDGMFSYDLTRSLFTTVFAPDGVPTIDGAGPLGLATVSAHVADIFSRVPDLSVTVDSSALTFDPVIGYMILKGAAPTYADLLDAIMRSCFGWWIEDRSGNFRIGTWTLPTGTPKAMILGSNRHELPDSTPSASLIGRIKTPPEAVHTVDPTWRITVGYRRNWYQQDAGGLAGSLTPGDREALSKTWKIAPWTDGRNRRQFRTRAPLPQIDTYLADERADAETLITLALPFAAEKRRQFDVQVQGLGLMSLDVNDVVLLEHPSPEKKLVGGKLAGVLAIEEDSRSDTIDLELFV